MSQTCLSRHSPNQLLAAYTWSATGSEHSLDAPVACKVSSDGNAHDRVGQIEAPGVQDHVVPGLSYRVVGDVDCAGVVHAQLIRIWRRRAQFGQQATKGARHDIGLARGQRKGLLLVLHAPGYRSVRQHEARLWLEVERPVPNDASLSPSVTESSCPKRKFPLVRG
eukprot:4214398-Pleurochrysis_carterae.AAC.1